MCFRDSIYPINEGCATFVLVLNVILPGVGTMVQSFCKKDCCWDFCTFLVGLLQLLSIVLLCFGWCWAVWHATMVRGVSSPDHFGRAAPETEDWPDAENQKE